MTASMNLKTMKMSRKYKLHQEVMPLKREGVGRYGYILMKEPIFL